MSTALYEISSSFSTHIYTFLIVTIHHCLFLADPLRLFYYYRFFPLHFGAFGVSANQADQDLYNRFGVSAWQRHIHRNRINTTYNCRAFVNKKELKRNCPDSQITATSGQEAHDDWGFA